MSVLTVKPEDHLDIASRVAGKYAGGNPALREELEGVGQLALVEAVPLVPEMLDVPLEAWLGQRVRWAILTHLKDERRHSSRRRGSIDDLVVDADGGGETPRSTLIPQHREDDPAKTAQLKEQHKARSLISECQVQTPVAEAGQWVARLRAACFDAVNETDMKDVMKAVVAKAKRGNLQAAKLLLDYLAGGRGTGPKQTVIVQQNIVDVNTEE